MNNWQVNVRQPSVDVHQFAMVPRADIPRSSFRMQHSHKTTISASFLVPVFLQEVLPGDSFKCSMTAFCRMSTPLFPIMDNMRLDSFFFFVPNRLVWKHWAKFQGEQDNPGDSTSFTIPTITSPVNGFPTGSLADYFGLPCAGQTAVGNTITVSSLPFRAYSLIFHQWFRDENLITARWIVGGASGGTNVPTDDDGPDAWTQYTTVGTSAMLTRGKRFDYFTGCLPWTQKSSSPVSIPLIGNATVRTAASQLVTGAQANGMYFVDSTGAQLSTGGNAITTQAGSPHALSNSTLAATPSGTFLVPGNLYADLSTATATTINALRLAFQTQRLLERDARGGTRYTEIVRSHFGVMSPDARLQRAEFLGGGTSAVNIAPVAQTSATGLTGGSSPMANLAAVGTIIAKSHGFRGSFTEHGHIIGLIAVTADLSYQQGIRRLWTRSTRYDFYMPVFAALGEQSVFNYEIYSDGSANDALTFGYQERWAEYRYFPSLITNQFRSTFSTPLDAWHLSQKFTALPALNASFITDPLQATLQRNLAAGASSAGQQFLCDFFFDMVAARPMPLYSVPGLIDHF